MGNICQGDQPLDTNSTGKNENIKTHKLLLLGSGESGKSTLFKRIQIKYGHGYAQEDRQEFIESIYENTIESMKTLIHQSKFIEEKHDCKMGPTVSDAAQLIESLSDDEYITKKIALSIEIL